VNDFQNFFEDGLHGDDDDIVAEKSFEVVAETRGEAELKKIEV